MMWKSLIFLAVISVVLAGKIKRHQTNYEFHIKHDYDYLKHHEKLDEHEHKTEEKSEESPGESLEESAEENQEPEHVEEKIEEEHVEGKKDESEEVNAEEGEAVNTESEEPEDKQKYEHQGYEFAYKVKDHHTHDIKGQHEKKSGGEVKGVYWLLQPDGLKRTVDYHADKHNGFHAKVDYSKPEEQEEDKLSKPTSEYFLTQYHGYKEYIPIKEEPEEEEDKQEESAQHIPIYVI